jgi:hypothetical protein
MLVLLRDVTQSVSTSEILLLEMSYDLRYVVFAPDTAKKHVFLERLKRKVAQIRAYELRNIRLQTPARGSKKTAEKIFI